MENNITNFEKLKTQYDLVISRKSNYSKNLRDIIINVYEYITKEDI